MAEYLNLQTGLVLLVSILLGWILGRLTGRQTNPVDADPRDSQIRSLQATVRVHKSDLSKIKADQASASEGLTDAQKTIDMLQQTLKERRSELEIIKMDRKAALEKTRELRAELQNRAALAKKAQARIRELETEISIARASSQLTASGGSKA